MRVTTITAILMLFSQVSFSQTRDVEILKKLNSNWINSYLTRDSATLNRIFADDFVLINHKGAKFTKQDMIANL